MKDFNKEDWKEVCENIRKSNKEYYASLPPEELRPYYYLEEREHINELGMSLKDYERIVSGHCRMVHEHVYKVCCLGEMCRDNIKHWRNEIRTHIDEMFRGILKDNMRKDKILMKILIKPFCDPKTFEPDGDDMYISAMNSEIANARKRPDDIRLRKDADRIKREILSNITQLRMDTKESVGVLMKDIYNGIVNRDWELIEQSLDAFIWKWVPDADKLIDLCDLVKS